uniref:Uncharacterized protein n=1 Tax=Oryza rufipogon TaxID=4529 RepID=A0A0E0R5A4_ORYRU
MALLTKPRISRMMFSCALFSCIGDFSVAAAIDTLRRKVALSWKEQNPEWWKLKKPVWDVTNWSRLFWLRSSKRGTFFF